MKPQALDNGKSKAIRFVVFQKAFDNISHSILLNNLAACSISWELLEYEVSYLSERK